MDWANLDVQAWLTSERQLMLLRAVIILVVGLLLARLASATLGRVLKKRATAHEAMIFRRLVYYPILALTLMGVLHQLGFNMGVLLGAAGILTVAVGFASQTSVSNLISGLFLIIERAFVVGDVIKVSGITGEVLSVDLLSVKLRTFDNLYVRLPNAEILSAPVVNLTHFPIRRFDMKVGVAYKEDIPRVREVLAEVADRNPLCLDQPEPLYIFKGFGDSALEMQFSVWAKRENYLSLINSIQEEIKAAFDAAGIEIPFPHRTLYTGSVQRHRGLPRAHRAARFVALGVLRLARSAAAPDPALAPEVDQEQCDDHHHRAQGHQVAKAPAQFRHIPWGSRVEVHAVEPRDEAEGDEEGRDDSQHFHDLVHPVADAG
jgi:small-conductance mechanosensitive channel